MTPEDELGEMLATLSGQPLQSAGRSAEIFWFQLGALHEDSGFRGRTRLLGEHALHISCSWRLRTALGLVVGREDFLVPREGKHQEFDSFEPNSSLGDELLNTLTTSWLLDPIHIQTVRSNQYGDLTIVFVEGYTLEVFPTACTDQEMWRIFKTRKGALPSRHIVRTGLGYK